MILAILPMNRRAMIMYRRNFPKIVSPLPSSAAMRMSFDM
jgi:hypothetical protein